MRLRLLPAPFLLSFFTCLLGYSPQASAYRPFDGTDADVAEEHEIEIELGPLQYTHEGHERVLVAPAVVFNVGLSDRLEFVLEGGNFITSDAAWTHPRTRVSDAGAFFKYLLREGSLQEGTGPSVATEIGALIPNGEGEATGASAALIASQRWSVGTVHLNAEAAWNREHRFEFFAGVILEAPEEWRARPVLELFVEHTLKEATELSALLGLIWPLRDGLSFDFGVRFAHVEGFVGEARAGLTWAIPARLPL